MRTPIVPTPIKRTPLLNGHLDEVPQCPLNRGLAVFAYYTSLNMMLHRTTFNDVFLIEVSLPKRLIHMKQNL